MLTSSSTKASPTLESSAVFLKKLQGVRMASGTRRTKAGAEDRHTEEEIEVESEDQQQCAVAVSAETLKAFARTERPKSIPSLEPGEADPDLTVRGLREVLIDRNSTYVGP